MNFTIYYCVCTLYFKLYELDFCKVKVLLRFLEKVDEDFTFFIFISDICIYTSVPVRTLSKLMMRMVITIYFKL